MKKFILLLVVPVLAACEGNADHTPEMPLPEVTLPEIAQLLSCLPIDGDNVREVHDAVTSSDANGYDEEYMMKDLLSCPGAGVGSVVTRSEDRSYPTPMRNLIRDYVSSRHATKSGGGGDVELYLRALEESGAQIYWPFSDEWDGNSLPVITFDPGTGASANVGYEIFGDADGDRGVREVIVDEQMAMRRPVWVVNANEDSSYSSVEVLRRDNPEWGRGGSVVVRSAPSQMKMLVLKELCMKRNFDTWFQGASEFFVKCGYVSDFKASTEEELLLYRPSITDFMVVVKRNQVGKPVPFDVILATDWTEQQESVAFMMVEDDGGTQTSWKLDAVVKVNSKSYGVEVNLPYHEKDDIVWRGSLSYSFFQKYDGSPQHFGDADLTFAIE